MKTIWQGVRGGLLLLGLWSVLLGAAACSGGEGDGGRYTASASAQRYSLSGVVRAVHRGDRTLSVEHGPIAGLMDGMTMDFHVQDRWVLDAAGPGDHITAILVLDGARSWLETVAISKIDADPAAPTSSGPSGMVAPGTPLPDVPFTNQLGERVRPSTYGDRTVVYTFIYTRCPLPDYCPLMVRRFNEIAARLEADGRRDDVWLVAVTLDPAFDTPAVLKAFGDRQVEASGGDRYRRVALLSGEPEAIREFAGFFQLTYDVEGDDEIVHGLRTVVVDASGRVVRVFRGTDWAVDELLAALPSVTDARAAAP